MTRGRSFAERMRSAPALPPGPGPPPGPPPGPGPAAPPTPNSYAPASGAAAPAVAVVVRRRGEVRAADSRSPTSRPAGGSRSSRDRPSRRAPSACRRTPAARTSSTATAPGPSRRTACRRCCGTSRRAGTPSRRRCCSPTRPSTGRRRCARADRTAFSNVLFTTRTFSNSPMNHAQPVVVPAAPVGRVPEDVVLERRRCRRAAAPTSRRARARCPSSSSCGSVELRIARPGRLREHALLVHVAVARVHDVVELDVVEHDVHRRRAGASRRAARPSGRRTLPIRPLRNVTFTPYGSPWFSNAARVRLGAAGVDVDPVEGDVRRVVVQRADDRPGGAGERHGLVALGHDLLAVHAGPDLDDVAALRLAVGVREAPARRPPGSCRCWPRRARAAECSRTPPRRWRAPSARRARGPAGVSVLT